MLSNYLRPVLLNRLRGALAQVGVEESKDKADEIYKNLVEMDIKENLQDNFDCDQIMAHIVNKVIEEIKDKKGELSGVFWTELMDYFKAKMDNEKRVVQEVQVVQEEAVDPAFTVERNQFFKRLMVKRGLRQLEIDSVLAKKVVPAQCRTFVMIPRGIERPTLHPGSDDRPHDWRGIDEADRDLMSLGESSIRGLIESGHKRVCPKLIFMMTSPDGRDRDDYRPHILNQYIQNMQSEKQQDNLVIHIAAHANENGIGASTIDKRLAPKELGEFLGDLLIRFNLAPAFGKENPTDIPLVIVFDACNTAYVDMEGLDVSTPSGIDTLKNKIENESMIGQFYQGMVEQGFTHLLVAGYRGYFSLMTSGHHAAIITPTREGIQKGFVWANEASFTISRHGVTLPTQSNQAISKKQSPVEQLNLRAINLAVELPPKINVGPKI